MKMFSRKSGLIKVEENERRDRRFRRYLLPFAMVVSVGIIVPLLTSETEAAGTSKALTLPPWTTTGIEALQAVAPMAGNDQSEPAVAYNSANGEYLAVWTEGDFGFANADIYGQRVSSTGALLGSNLIIAAAHLRQGAPAVAYNSTSGEYLVVWYDRRPDDNYDIYGQRVSGSGALLGSNFPISTAAENQLYPALAYNSANGEYLVVWEDDRSDTTLSDIYGQRVSGSGALLGGEITLSAVSEDQLRPTLSFSSASAEYIVAWWDGRPGAANADIYGQRVSGSGALLGGNFPISTASGLQLSPAVAYNSTSAEYLVVWDDRRSASNNETYGQRVSSTGALLGGEMPFSTAPGDQFHPAIAYNSTGNEYLVVWTDRPTGSSSDDTYGQRVSASGALVGTPFPTSTALGSQFSARVAYNSSTGGYLVVWQDTRAGGTFDADIWAQRVSGVGALQGNNFPLTVQPVGTATPTSIPAATATPAPPTATPTPCVPGQFSDVPPGSAFHTFITCLYDRGIVSGYSDCTFRPNADVTRGQLSKIVSNAAGYSDTPTGQTFTDVAPGSTFYVFIERMASRGIIGGYTDGTLRPNNNSTRGQIAKIVSNAKGYDETPTGQTFTDVAPGSTFYVFVERIAARGIIGGYMDGTFRPNNNATRGQSSKIVANAFFPECQAP